MTGNSEVAPGENLFSFLGVRRSIDGPNMIARVCHSTSPKIEVIARYVENQAAFDALSESDLIGPTPFERNAQPATQARQH